MSLPSSSVAALVVSDPSRWRSANGASDHLSGPDQELATPPEIVASLNALLVGFAAWEPPGAISCDGLVGSDVGGLPGPANAMTPSEQRLPLRPQDPRPHRHRTAHSVSTAAGTDAPTFTRYLDMPRDVFINRLQNMIDQGEFSHIGSAEVRVEGSTAWGVWARVSHWPGGLGRHRRMRCGVLYHVANRSCTFHGSARDALQLLLPLFESWTYASMTDLPSVRTPGEAAEPLALESH